MLHCQLERLTNTCQISLSHTSLFVYIEQFRCFREQCTVNWNFESLQPPMTYQSTLEITCSRFCTCNGFVIYLSYLKYWLLGTGEDEAPEKDDMNAKEENEPPHKKNKKHRKHKSKKKKRKRKGEKESSSESGAESDVEPPPPPRPVRTTRAR